MAVLGFMWLGAVAGMKVSTSEPGLNFLPVQRKEHLDFLISLPRCGAEEEGRMVGLENCQQTSIRNGIRLIIANFCCGNNP